MIRPRLTDYFGILKPQCELDFAIPLLTEDIPLYVDPFLLWKSPSFQDKALHGAILNAFNHIGYLANQGRVDDAVAQLITGSECDEVGLGVSAKTSGLKDRQKPSSRDSRTVQQHPSISTKWLYALRRNSILC
jgi:hypothetical protein